MVKCSETTSTVILTPHSHNILCCPARKPSDNSWQKSLFQGSSLEVHWRPACTCRAFQRQADSKGAQPSSPGLLRGQTVALSTVSVISLPKAIIRKHGDNLLLPQGSHDRAILNVKHKSGARTATTTRCALLGTETTLSDRSHQVGHSLLLLPFPKSHVPSPTPSSPILT